MVFCVVFEWSGDEGDGEEEEEEEEEPGTGVPDREEGKRVRETEGDGAGELEEAVYELPERDAEIREEGVFALRRVKDLGHAKRRVNLRRKRENVMREIGSCLRRRVTINLPSVSSTSSFARSILSFASAASCDAASAFCLSSAVFGFEEEEEKVCSRDAERALLRAASCDRANDIAPVMKFVNVRAV